jgi:LacI family transcriptional regulator
LSSIEQGAHRIGYEAAQLLDRMMSGKRLGKRRLVIDPKGIVTRQSTDVLAIDNSIVARAMVFIQEHAIARALKCQM